MHPSLTFHPKDGSARIDGVSLTLCKGLHRAKASLALNNYFRQAQDFGNGYEWLFFHNVLFGGQPCGFALCFLNGSLTQLDFSVMLPESEMEDGWPTRAAIQAELLFVRKALSSQLGVDIGERGARFTWGTVWSAFDNKGFQASSGLRYDA